MKLSELAADLELEEEGVWVPVQGEFEVKLCAASSKRAQKAYRKYLRPHERKIAAGAMKDEEIVPIVAKYIAHGLLLDWKGVEGDDEKPLPFSVDVAEQTLKLPEMKYLRKQLQDLAAAQETFRRVEIEKDADDLKGGSAGSSIQIAS